VVLKKYSIVKLVFKTLKKIELGQNVYKVLKKYGNSKFGHLFIQILHFAAGDRFADVFCIVFYE